MDQLQWSANYIRLKEDYLDCFHFHFSSQHHRLQNLQIQILQTQIFYHLHFHYLFNCVIILNCLRKKELGFYKNHWMDKRLQTHNYKLCLSKHWDSSPKQLEQIIFNLIEVLHFLLHQIQIQKKDRPSFYYFDFRLQLVIITVVKFLNFYYCLMIQNGLRIRMVNMVNHLHNLDHSLLC